MSEKRNLLKTSALVSFLTLISRLAGLARDVLIASLLGVSRLSDVFWLAFEIPSFARRVLGEGALSAFIVPVFAGRRKVSELSGWQLVNRTMNALALATLALVVLGMIFSLPIFKATGGIAILAGASGESPELFAEVERVVGHGGLLTRIMLPFLTALAIASVMMGVCHGLGSFAAPALGSIVLNVAMIAAGALALFTGVDPSRATVWLAVAVLAGAAARVAIMVPVLMRAGWRWKPELSTRDRGVRELFAMMGVGLFGLSIYQINTVLAGLLAAFNPGSKTFLVYAQRLIQFPLALTAAALATAMLPRLSDLVIEGRRRELGEVMGFAKRLDLIIMLPAVMGLMFFGLPICELLFEHGRWTPEDSLGVYGALFFYAPGLLPQGWLRLILPLYYARKDVRTPVKAAAVSMVVNIVLGAAFTFWTDLNQIGLAIAGSIASVANYSVLMWFLRRDPLRPEPDPLLGTTLTKTALAAIVSVGGCRLLYLGCVTVLGHPQTFLLRAALLLPVMALSALLYFALCHALKVPDSDRAVALIRERLRSRS